MRSFTTSLAYFQTILLINGSVNTSAFVVLPSRSISTRLHAGSAPTGAELLKKTIDDAAASASSISATKPSGGNGAGVDIASNFNAFWDSLQITENGAVYVAGLAVFVAGLNNRAKGKEVAEAQAKAIEAADAAELAAKGASLTKQLAENACAEASKKAEQLLVEKKAIEVEVSKLKLESAKAIETADKSTKDATSAKEKSRALDIEATKKDE